MVETPSRVSRGPSSGDRRSVERWSSPRRLQGAPPPEPFSPSASRRLGRPVPAASSPERGRNFSDRSGGASISETVEQHLHLPVVYNNDGNAWRYTHTRHFGADAIHRSSISAYTIVGTRAHWWRDRIPVRWFTERVEWRASWGTCTFRCMACSRAISHYRSATLRISRRSGGVASLNWYRESSLLPFWLTQYDHLAGPRWVQSVRRPGRARVRRGAETRWR